MTDDDDDDAPKAGISERGPARFGKKKKKGKKGKKVRAHTTPPTRISPAAVRLIVGWVLEYSAPRLLCSQQYVEYLQPVVAFVWECCPD